MSTPSRSATICENVGDVALAVRRGADHDLHRARRHAAHLRGVPAAGDVAQRAEDPRRGEPAHLRVGREADPEAPDVAARVALGLLAPEALVVEELERPVERGVEVAGVHRRGPTRSSRELPHEVEPPQLDRILAELAGERVDRVLDRVGRLGATGAAVGVGRRRVREHAAALERVALHVVAAAVEPGPEQRDAGRDELHVRAHRGEQPDPDRRDLALGRGGELDLLDHVAAVDRREVALRALLDPLHGPAELPREREAERLLGVDVELRAEAAADVGGDDPQLRLRDARDERQGRAQDVRDLRRRPEREVARRRRLHEHAAGLDRVRDQPLLAVALAHGDGRLGEQPVDLAGLHRPRVRDVRAELVVQDRGAVLRRLDHVRDGRQRLVFDLDELGGVLRQSTRSSRARPRRRRPRSGPCRS